MSQESPGIDWEWGGPSLVGVVHGLDSLKCLCYLYMYMWILSLSKLDTV